MHVPFLDPAASWTFPSAEFLVNVAIKATVLLFAVFLATAILRRSSSALRHFLWLAAVIGMLLLPLLSLALPTWSVLPQWMSTHAPVTHAPSTPDQRRNAPPSPALPSMQQVDDAPPRIVMSAPPATHNSTATPASIPQARTPSPAPVAAKSSFPFPWPAAMLLAWALGTIVSLIWIIAGFFAATRRRRKSIPLADPSWALLLATLRSSLRIRRDIRLLESPQCSVPMTFGILRPTIVLSPDVHDLPLEKRRVVLLHELAHVKRWDCFSLFLAQFARSLYWFHPLAWLAVARLRAECERACDDRVLQTGEKGSDYASTLLRYASIQPSCIPTSALAMARHSTLEGRLLAILDPRHNRKRLARSTALVLLAIAAAITIPMAMLHAQSPAPQAKSPSPPTTAPSNASSTTSPAAGRAFTITLHEKSTGKPLADADIVVDICYHHALKFKTAADGTVQVDLPDAASEGFTIKAHKDGFVPLAFRWRPSQDSKTPAKSFTWNLEHGTTVSGRVVDQDDQPLENATVAISVEVPDDSKTPGPDLYNVTTRTDAQGKWSFNTIPEKFSAINIDCSHPLCLDEKTSYTLPKFENIPALRDGSARLTLNRGTPVELTVVDSNNKPIPNAKVVYLSDHIFAELNPPLLTNDQGCVSLGMKPGFQASFVASAKDFAPETKTIKASNTPSKVSVTLPPPSTLTGRVVDMRGKPVADVTISVDEWRDSRTQFATIHTDKDGVFTWTSAPADAVKAFIWKTGYAQAMDVSLVAGQKNEITIKDPTTFHGSVVDAATGKPLTAFKVFTAIDWKAGDHMVNWDHYHNAAPGKHDNGEFDLTFTDYYAAEYFRVEADGYGPADSPSIDFDGHAHSFAFKLAKAGALTATITSNSNPVENADACFLGNGERIQVMNGKVEEHFRKEHPFSRSDKEGRISFPPASGKFLIVVLADAGWAKVTNDDLAKSSTVTLSPWAKIEGTLRLYTHTVANHKIQGGNNLTPEEYENPPIFWSIDTVTDAQGRFTIDRVFPGQITLWDRAKPNNAAIRPAITGKPYGVTAEAGKTITLDFGGSGRPVVAHIKLPPELKNASFPSAASIKSNNPRPQLPDGPDPDFSLPLKEQQRAYLQWMSTEAGKKIAAERNDNFLKDLRLNAEIAPDGAIRAEEIPAGSYTLAIDLFENVQGANTSTGHGKINFVVPAIPNGVSDEPLDIGDLVPTPVVHPKVGDSLPKTTLKTVDGKDLPLEDYKGKYVLLHFWNMDDASLAAIPQLKAVYDAFAGSNKLVMIGVSFAEASDAPSKFSKARNLQWQQTFLPEWRYSLADQLNIYFASSICLISPDGKLLAKGIPPDQLKATLAQYLNAK